MDAPDDCTFEAHEAPTLRGQTVRRAAPAGLLTLVVDDDPDARAMYCACLEHLGHQPIACESGLEAIGAARRHRPDAALMDVAMPVLDGIRTTRILKDERQDVFVVVMTAFCEAELFDAALAAGAEAFLSKPFNPFVLRELLAPVERQKDRLVVKVCGCGRAFTRAQWRDLPFCGIMRGAELRNCHCGSSLALVDGRKGRDA